MGNGGAQSHEYFLACLPIMDTGSKKYGMKFACKYLLIVSRCAL